MLLFTCAMVRVYERDNRPFARTAAEHLAYIRRQNPKKAEAP